MTLGSFRSWLQLFLQTGPIDWIYLPRLLFVCTTTLATGPLKLWEQVRYGRSVREAAVHPAPIFIIGHWRSGTTHLHNLLCQDRNLGYLSTFQAMAPGFCLVGDRAIKHFIARKAQARYPTRLIDNIPLSFDAPQEDEFALANVTPHAFIHTFSFPRQAKALFARAVLFDKLSSEARSKWIATYEKLLRKATVAAGGKRLVIKNCAHSARIETLLELFPNAKFIHIHRNPYEVFLSTLHMHRTVLPRSQLQKIEPERIETHVLCFYRHLMRRFLADRSRIPSGNLVEVRFKDLETSPLMELRRVYNQLGLPGFGAAETDFRAYIDSVSDYRKNSYRLDDEVIRKVNRNWAFSFEAWNYDRLEPQA